MRKPVAVILLCTIILSMLATFSIGTFAEGTGDDRTASYAILKPTIDGEVDSVWEGAEKHYILFTSGAAKATG
ncbi:MAG: hypothetical protein ACI3XQ_03120, partial [Eubacteriales bacterium]